MSETDTIAKLAEKHGVSKGAAEVVLDAIRRGGGTMAQFSHPEFGGMAQWSSGGMTMTGDLFNDQQRAKLSGLAKDLASYLASGESDKKQEQSRARSEGTPVATKTQPNWWPDGLGDPGSTGSQNAMRYAVFPAAHRLAIDDGKEVRVYDTADHRIVGASQSQGASQDLKFSTATGSVDLHSLKQIT